MELGDLKGAWAQYDKKLTENLKLNEELLRKINLNNCKRELQKPLSYEILNIVLLFLVLAYVIGASIRVISEPKFCIPGFILSCLCILGLVTSVIKVNRFLAIDYYGSSVLKLQKDIASLNKLLLRWRKYELALFPIFTIFTILLHPLFLKIVYNIDLYQNLKFFIIMELIIIVISYPVILWLFKYLYDNKFKSVEQLLSELNKFEEEV